MCRKISLFRPLLACLLCLFGFGGFSLLVALGWTVSFDLRLINFIQGLETPLLTKIMKFFTYLGNPVPLACISAMAFILLSVIFRRNAEGIFFAGVLAGSVLLNETIKQIFRRSRPAFHRIIDIGGFSFPSGHSMAAFSLYGMLAFLLWRHIRSAAGRGLLLFSSAAMILLIGVSRIYLGVHYPSDVAGGYLAGASWLFFSIWIGGKLKKDGTISPPG